MIMVINALFAQLRLAKMPHSFLASTIQADYVCWAWCYSSSSHADDNSQSSHWCRDMPGQYHQTYAFKYLLIYKKCGNQVFIATIEQGSNLLISCQVKYVPPLWLSYYIYTHGHAFRIKYQSISCKLANSLLCSSTSTERMAMLPDKCTCNVYDDVIHCWGTTAKVKFLFTLGLGPNRQI